MKWAVVNSHGYRMHGAFSKFHIMPLDDLRSHEPRARCWCSPTPDADEPDVMTHHSMDGREAFETGERLAS